MEITFETKQENDATDLHNLSVACFQELLADSCVLCVRWWELYKTVHIFVAHCIPCFRELQNSTCTKKQSGLSEYLSGEYKNWIKPLWWKHMIYFNKSNTLIDFVFIF